VPVGDVEAVDDDSPPVDERPLEERLDLFWESGDELELVAPRPRPPEVANAVLKRLGDAPVSIDGANLSSYLARAYDVAGHAALEKAARNGKRDFT